MKWARNLSSDSKNEVGAKKCKIVILPVGVGAIEDLEADV
mgnify:CR=1 FL=1